MFLDDKTDNRTGNKSSRFGIALPAVMICAVMLAGLTINVRAQTPPSEHRTEAVILSVQPAVTSNAQPDNAPPRTESQPAETAPSALTTGSITRSFDNPTSKQATAHHAISLSLTERNFVLAVLAICFAVMAAGALSLWRRSYREISKAADRGRKR